MNYRILKYDPYLQPFQRDIELRMANYRRKKKEILPKGMSLLDFANKHNLLTTGGSDFHGMYTSTPRPLGIFTAPDETIQLMQERKKALSK